MWPASFARDGGRYSATTVGIMIDERFSTVIHAVRPEGCAVVTSELSVDLVHMTGSGTGGLRSAGEILTRSPNSALARAWLRDDAGALVAAATTLCRFIDRGHDDDGPYPSAPKPPADLPLHALLETTPADRQTVRASFAPDARCGNDLGTLHGGIAFAVTLEVGLAWLRLVYGRAAASSVRLDLLRPMPLDRKIEIEATPIHMGRTFAAAMVTARNAATKPTLAAMINGVPAT